MKRLNQFRKSYIVQNFDFILEKTGRTIKQACIINNLDENCSVLFVSKISYENFQRNTH